jgi:predicted  nucleic acid-binding Zn-ribbon protein
MSVSCLNCGFLFENEDHNRPCPKCGSRNRSVTLTGEIKFHSRLKLRKKGLDSKKHKHRFDQEIISGERIGKDGKLVTIERFVDPEHASEQGSYKETVKDEHGQVIVQKDEKLSEHR